MHSNSLIHSSSFTYLYAYTATSCLYIALCSLAVYVVHSHLLNTGPTTLEKYYKNVKEKVKYLIIT